MRGLDSRTEEFDRKYEQLWKQWRDRYGGGHVTQQERSRHFDNLIAEQKAEFAALEPEVQLELAAVDFAPRGMTKGTIRNLRSIRIADAATRLRFLQRFAELLARGQRGSVVLEDGTTIFNRVLEKWPEDPSTPEFLQLYSRVFAGVKGCREVTAAGGSAYGRFQGEWSAYVQRHERDQTTQSGMLLFLEPSSFTDWVARIEPIILTAFVYREFGEARRNEAEAFLELLALARGRVPGARWISRLEEMLKRIPGDVVKRLALGLVKAGLQEPGPPVTPGQSILFVTDEKVLATARAIVWVTSRFLDDDLLAAYVSAGKRLGRVSGLGSSLLGALAWAISASGHRQCASALQKLVHDVTQKPLKASIEKLLAALAASRGLGLEDFAEESAETHGLDASGQRAWKAGDHRIILTLREGNEPGLAVFDTQADKECRSVPAALKGSPELREAKTIQKALARDVLMHRDRLEIAMVKERTWTAARWHSVIGTHPVVGQLARRVIWSVDGRDAFFDAAWSTLDGRPVDVRDDATVSLPHPVTRPLAQVRAWQAALVRRRASQPFKQAFRETYVPTPAELETRLWSERFATHLVRFKQVYAILKGRGWSGLGWEGGDAGWRDFPQGPTRARLDVETRRTVDEGLFTLTRVSFRVRDAGGRADSATPWTPTRHTDEGWRQVPLAEVHPVAFSEAMRDVDLVAAAAGAGTDAEWRAWDARRAAGELRWDEERERQSAANLVTAEARRRLLEELLPVLGLEKSVTFDGSWALVRGVKRNYRVHLASGVAHLDPEGRYLCIVAVPSTASTPLLPWTRDDDRTSAILSKIHLLAHDDRIRDAFILKQIEGS